MAEACKGCPKTKTYSNAAGTWSSTTYLCNECDKVMFPVPPVCTAYWNAADWAKYIQMYGVDKEPATIETSSGTWHKTGATNEQGEALYRLE